MTELKLINNELDRLLDMDEAARVLGIKKSTLYDLCMRKKLRVVKIGKLNKFRKQDLESFVNSNIVEPSNP